MQNSMPCHLPLFYCIAQIPIAAPLFTMVVARALGSFRPRRCSHVISRHAAVRAGVNYSEEKLWLAFASVAAIAMLNVQDDNEDNTIRNRTRCDFNSDYHSSLLHRYSKEKNDKNNQKIMHTKYNIDWSNVLGEGAYGKVYLARVADTGEKVALKKISKRYTNSSAFISETAALWRVYDTGGHPNISGLRDMYEDDSHFYVILELARGGELFDHLIKDGSYSEKDASRLISEILSALAFLHNIGVKLLILGAPLWTSAGILIRHSNFVK
jgi:hypothetical protein